MSDPALPQEAVDAIDAVFANMNFGPGVDADIMARLMASMKAEMSAEVAEVMGRQQPAARGGAPVSSRPWAADTPALNAAGHAVAPLALPAPPASDTTPPVLRVSLLRFDGVKDTVVLERVTYDPAETAGAFVERLLASQGAHGGESRLDRGGLEGLTPATRVQPLWQPMAEALLLPRDAAVAAATGSAAAAVELTVHWYPSPLPGDEVGSSWVRVVTVTRRSLFVPFDGAVTTLADLQASTEAQAGVPVEWQRLYVGARRIDGGGGNGASSGDGGGGGGGGEGEGVVTPLLSDLGVRAGSSVFLTARVEGFEYGGANRDLA